MLKSFCLLFYKFILKSGLRWGKKTVLCPVLRDILLKARSHYREATLNTNLANEKMAFRGPRDALSTKCLEFGDQLNGEPVEWKDQLNE